MPVIQPGLFQIMHRFPQHKKVLREKYLQNKAFKALCHDYRQCSNALHHWMQSKHEQAPARCREYANLLQDLEIEIKQSLD